MPIRQTITINNHRISYLEWNQGKKPLILLHGLADHALVWSSLGEYLAKDYHILAVDMLGHGESDKPKTGYTSPELIADLEGLMNHYGWDRADILGHSWTAKLIALWATKNPAKFKKMLLVDPFFIDKMPTFMRFTFPFFYKILPFLKAMGPFSSYEEAENIAKGLKQYRGWSKLQEEVFKFSLEKKADGQWGSKFVASARDGIFEDVMLVAGLTKPVEIPTLLIKPTQGLNRTKWQIKSCLTCLKNLQIVEVTGNHWAFLVAPDEFNQVVRNFLL
jgi:pimeloyl-ACP methyl ester carboxylesterase